jgi:hypothetical protein
MCGHTFHGSLGTAGEPGSGQSIAAVVTLVFSSSGRPDSQPNLSACPILHISSDVRGLSIQQRLDNGYAKTILE